MPPIDEFEKALQSLIGQTCWAVTAGAVGAMASLDIGAKVERDQPLPFPNKNLDPELHRYQGKYVLYLEDCPWRLDSPDAIVTAWTDNNAPRGPLVTGLKRLEGQAITAVALTRPGLDLTLTFANNLTLCVFPDQTDPDAGDNYSLTLHGGAVYIVGARSQLTVED